MSFFEELSELERDNIPFAIVTIINAEGRSARHSGRMAVTKTGSFGTIGGGEMEDIAKREARAAIEEGRGKNLRLETDGGGKVDLFVDVAIKDRSLIIIGKGHVGIAIERIFKSLSWHVISLERNAGKEDIPFSEINRNTAVVIAGSADSTLSRYFLKTDAFYIGILSSRRDRSIMKDRRIYAPIGLDIGGESPEEVAISVSAEILSVFYKRSQVSLRKWNEKLVLVRGAGDLATAVIVRLKKAGYSVIATEIKHPTVIRRTVSLAEAMYEEKATVEGVTAVHTDDVSEVLNLIDEGFVPILDDPDLTILSSITPKVLVDATIAKRNLGTRRDMADLVIALGPGFEAKVDADVVIETKRGHTLGRIIRDGKAIENTGIPGLIGGYSSERVIRSPAKGIFKGQRKIGDIVGKGDVIATVNGKNVLATIDGKLRGLLRDDLPVPEGFKIADIDPRGEDADHLSISDKARCISGSVLEVIDNFISS